MGRLSKIASVMLVVGFVGLLFMTQIGVDQAFERPEQRVPLTWEEGLINLVSMVLFFGGALLYIFDWARARIHK